jgi:aminoglycoside phosphotransferase (APT) family kinase protein
MSRPDRDLARLESWLARQVKVPCRIVAQNSPKTGFSADTVVLTVEGLPGSDGLVVRIDHPAKVMFADATMARQAQMMAGLHERGVPVPRVIGWSDDPTILGAPFLVMQKASGVPLPQHPSYHVAGLLTELDPAGRVRAWRTALTTIAQINRLPWQEFAFLLQPAYGEPGLEHYLGWIRACRLLACGDAEHPVIDPAIAWLQAHRPRETAVELLWGDSNPGNFLFGQDGSVSVALDFEAASIGPAEIDLAWWFVVDRMLAAGNPLPAGMPDRAAQMSLFESALGRELGDLKYYEVLAALRMSMVIARAVRVLQGSGDLPAENSAARLNPAASMLAGMIGIHHPVDMSDYMQMVMVMNKR